MKTPAFPFLLKMTLVFLALLFILPGCILSSPQVPFTITSEPVILPSEAPVIPVYPSPTNPSALPDQPAVSAQQAVEEFYNAHIASPNKLLVDRAYSSSLYLSSSFIARLDKLLSDKQNPLNSDPFLTTQALPESVSFETYAEADKQARILVHQLFGIYQVDLAVDVEFEERGWQITQIQRGNPKTPDGVVWLFYGWYLDYVHTKVSPLADLAYQDSPYLSSAFVERIHQQTAEQGSVVADPLVISKIVPDYFSTYAPVEEDGRASVIVEFHWKSGRDLLMLKVYLINQEGHWLIDHVTDEVAAVPVSVASSLSSDYAEWNIFVDEEYGFSIPYPQGWVVKPAEAFSPPLSDEGLEMPLKRQYLWMPEDIYEEEMSKRFSNNGWQPPSAPERTIPYIVNIYRSSRQAVEDSNLPMISTTQVTLNGYPAEMLISINGKTVQYLFQHPYQSDLWLVFMDILSSDLRYEVQARELEGVFELMLGGIVFTE
jgi:hypothetical protein